MEIIELYDESGNLQKFRLLDTFGMDDNDYAVVIPIEDDNDITYIFKIKKEQDDYLTFEGIDDEELSNAVEIYEKLKEENIQ